MIPKPHPRDPNACSIEAPRTPSGTRFLSKKPVPGPCNEECRGTRFLKQAGFPGPLRQEFLYVWGSIIEYCEYRDMGGPMCLGAGPFSALVAAGVHAGRPETLPQTRTSKGEPRAD